MVNRDRALVRHGRAGAGFTLIELLFVIAILAALLGVGIPLVTSGLDEMRTGIAARYVASRVTQARMDALQRSAAVALRFEPLGSDYAFRTYADGNSNGVRTAEIEAGTDVPLTSGEQLSGHFAEVRFGLAAGIPDLDGVRQPYDADGVRIGVPRILTLSANGTASSGTLYIRGRRGQYAVRILGATARTRVFQYHAGGDSWIAR